ncbi:M16 family metallopeptidase [Reichenbachiella versicolor]|uniref:M16 family metallopeptidase n=1 Tax=Reichenbachiella versicolor TaxID=1821036 RepID=UPI000D6E3490|nr:M16 family metallopeptidase [Reichenbachiella versicolor]
MKITTQYLLVFCLAFTTLFAHGQVENKPLPFDESIRTGTLDNGLKYFIKKNAKPEKRVELRLAVNAGSVLEDEDQLGLAHFTEHMAFNGSENFDKNDLVDYLQSIGVKFGAHLNAYTSFDETVYILPVPSDDQEILDKSLTILKDWAGGIAFEVEELEKERGVIIEEWRIGQGAQMRMIEQYLPVIFKGSKYAERIPIGKKDILEKFDQATIQRFYKDWYRPNLMAVVAVGDIDVDEMEAKIKEKFSSLTNPKNERQRPEFDLPDNVKPIATVVSDKEATNYVFNIMFKTDTEDFKTTMEYRKMMINNLFLMMINQRLNDKTQEANPPYLYATSYIGSPVSRKKTAFSAIAVPKPDDIEGGVKTLLEEIRRVQQHGFNPSELKTAKLDMYQGYESSYKERDKASSKPLANELVRHFLEGEPVPGIAFEFEFVQEVLPGIKLEEINALISTLIKEENRVLLMTAPESSDVTLPTDQDLLSWVSEIEKKDMDALEERVIDENLIKGELKSGTILSHDTIESVDVQKLKLSNGAVVYLKQTDFKDDQIIFSAYREGGISSEEDDKYWSASMTTDVITMSGIADYSFSDLEKALAGKSAGVAPYMRNLESGFRGKASPDDIETLLQLVYLYCNEPREDKDAFQSMMQRNEAALSNVLSDPKYFYQDKLARIMTQNHLRSDAIPTIEDLRKADLDEIMAIFKKHFSSTGDFTYWFVGNFDTATLLPLIKKYLGSQDAKREEIKWVDRGVRTPSGVVKEKVFKGSDQKSNVTIRYTGETKYDKDQAYYLRCLGEILSIQLIEELREEKGGVYGIGAKGGMSKKPYSRYNLKISFPCSPDRADELIASAQQLVKDIKKNGIDQKYLDKIKEAQRRDVELHLKSNNYWAGALKTYHISNIDYDKLNHLTDRIEKLTTKDIQKAAKKYIKDKNYIQVVLYPENMKE